MGLDDQRVIWGNAAVFHCQPSSPTDGREWNITWHKQLVGSDPHHVSSGECGHFLCSRKRAETLDMRVLYHIETEHGHLRAGI